MKNCRQAILLGAAVFSIGFVPADLYAVEPEAAPSTSAPVSAAEESNILVVIGSLVKIDRKAAWPRIDMVTTTGESWMLELPNNVSLAWYQGRPQNLDDLKYGQWIKVLYIKVNGKKRVRSVQILPGFRDASGQADASAGPPEETFPKAPEIPSAPILLNSKTPRIPELPTTRTPEAPTIPSIPIIDTSRQR